MKFSHNKFNLRAGFTLMELLVTISIIALLAAILLPTMNRVIEKAEKNEAQTGARSIALAVEAYFNEYSKIPEKYATSESPVLEAESRQIIRCLLGYDDGGNDHPNPRGTVFLKSPDGQNNGTFLDPWDNQYAFILDQNYDGKVPLDGSEVSQTVVVYSFGPDGRNNEGREDDITSIGK